MNILNKKHFLKVQDHSVSKEFFDLYLDQKLDMLITHPQPSSESLGRYYESEDYISHTDSKRSLFEWAYHFVKKITIQNKLNLINKYSSEKGTVLDIGAGTGDFLVKASHNGWNCLGIEPNKNAVDIANKKGVIFIENTLGLDGNLFDVITMWHVLEHVPDLEGQIHELKRLLKPNGTIFIAVPNFKSFDANHYAEFWAAYDVPIHFWHFSKKSIEILFQNHNLYLNKTIPMKFDSFYVSLLSEKFKHGKMRILPALFVGLFSNLKGVFTSEFSSHIYVLKRES